MSIISLTLNRFLVSDVRDLILRYIHGNRFMEQCEVCHLRRHIRYGSVYSDFDSGDNNGRKICSGYCFNVIYARLDELEHLMQCSDSKCPCKKYDKHGMRKKILTRRYPISAVQNIESILDSSISCIRTLFMSNDIINDRDTTYIIDYYDNYIHDLDKSIINAFSLMWYHTFHPSDPKYRNLISDALQGEGIEELMYIEESAGIKNGILAILESTKYR